MPLQTLDLTVLVSLNLGVFQRVHWVSPGGSLCRLEALERLWHPQALCLPPLPTSVLLPPSCCHQLTGLT